MRLARALSLILIPPFVSAAVFTILILRHRHEGPGNPIFQWLVAVLCAGGLQMVHVLFLRHRALVSAYDVPDRLQRTVPYFISSILSALGFVLLVLLHAPADILALMWCFAANTPILAVINMRWKISAHMMGFTGPPVLVVDAMPLLLPPLLPIGVALGWARVTTGAHTPAQVLAGAAAGVVLTLLQLQFFFQIIEPCIPALSM